ncbi:F-box/FBD/LRR-repeat protein [Trifolium pratense]|uniref:F-box/FBD/LRR-repeat protein n=1 Tax=Trifolium pratense TaxID=57577 RepID=A0A2K3N1A0_TRIPR|nr:F-box/FBD/LRR-repeat protein At1g13570-like isoform X1 [Trifolium pratense]PNX96807.1 F-box/FBD/LRR-repeat protein [Trifolium pratense]
MAIKMDNIDRISDLPSNVIDGILEHLDIQDQVRTSILSTKWRYLWTSVPQLKFDTNFFDSFQYLDNPGPVVVDVITDVIMIHNGPIYKFTLSIPYGDEITMEHLSKWFQILSGRRDIKYLELANFSTAFNQMPDIVFSWKELTDFKFYGFNLSIPPNSCCFKKLVNLYLHCVAFESGALEGLISSCPLLEKLSIQHCDGFEYFDFAAPSLKVLYLDIDQDTKSICLKKAKNLIDLTLVADGGWVSGLIKSLPKIQNLNIHLWFDNKILPIADVIPPMLLKSSFGSIECLKLDGVCLNECRELLYIVSVLKSAPSLVELVIQGYDCIDITPAPDHLEEFECSSCCLNRLQTVDISIKSCPQYAMCLIEFILANSASLETLTFRVGLGPQRVYALVLLGISQDLLLMKRASQRAQVEFLHFGDD